MNHRINGTRIIIAGALLALAGAANASDRSRAKEAIAAADLNIQAAWRAGAADKAYDAQNRAVAALDRARRQLNRSHEHHAFYAAREAQAYAQLALATSQSTSAR